jgi:ATP-dependent DNA helicase 2 subunit 1
VYPQCYLLTNLDVPGADEVKRVRDLVEGRMILCSECSSHQDFERYIMLSSHLTLLDTESFGDLLTPSEEPVTMSNVLFCANQIFTTKHVEAHSRLR